MSNDKLEINKRMIGKSVWVFRPDENGFFGEIMDALDEETFLVRKGTQTFRVNIFDIRSAE